MLWLTKGILYLAVAAITAVLAFLTWYAQVWGFSPATLTPSYLLGVAVSAGLVMWARCIGRKPHA